MCVIGYAHSNIIAAFQYEHNFAQDFVRMCYWKSYPDIAETMRWLNRTRQRVVDMGSFLFYYQMMSPPNIDIADINHLKPVYRI